MSSAQSAKTCGISVYDSTPLGIGYIGPCGFFADSVLVPSMALDIWSWIGDCDGGQRGKVNKYDQTPLVPVWNMRCLGRLSRVLCLQSVGDSDVGRIQG